MKIVLTGGGTGGHFYPIVAVAQEINRIARDNKFVPPEIYYFAPASYDKNALFENNITWIHVPAGKLRRYFSVKNFFDLFVTASGIVKAIRELYKIYPDVVFGKGGFASFPVMFAARFLRIPVVIHESDSVPGRVNKWAGKFAVRVAVSYAEASKFFKEDKVAYTGNPVRNELTHPVREGAHDFLKLEQTTPTILILGGSQGSQIINDTVLDALPTLVQKYQVLHQTGKANYAIVTETAKVVLHGSKFAYRYRPYDHLNVLTLRMAAGAANVVVTRAGSSLFEIALWEVPCIVIPIKSSNGDHQRENAFNYARTGAAIVLEENNLSPHLLIAEIDRILTHPKEIETMKAGAHDFAKPNAAALIANEIVDIALSHV